MKHTARRLLHATTALAGVATVFALPGTALADTLHQDNMAREQAPDASALGDQGTSSLGSPESSHAFELPTAHSVPVSDRTHNDDYGDQDGIRGNGHYDYDDPQDSYSDTRQDNVDYVEHHRATKDATTQANADKEERHSGYPQCGSDYEHGSYGYGYNGVKDNDGDADSDDDNPKCDGQHAQSPAGSENYTGYVGSDRSRQHNEDYTFGKFI
jgi:hypothetical protein